MEQCTYLAGEGAATCGGRETGGLEPLVVTADLGLGLSPGTLQQDQDSGNTTSRLGSEVLNPEMDGCVPSSFLCPVPSSCLFFQFLSRDTLPASEQVRSWKQLLESSVLREIRCPPGAPSLALCLCALVLTLGLEPGLQQQKGQHVSKEEIPFHLGAPESLMVSLSSDGPAGG